MWTRIKYYYIAYDIHLENDKIIHGTGTFEGKKPAVEKWIAEIKKHTEENKIICIQILSCIQVKKDFIL